MDDDLEVCPFCLDPIAGAELWVGLKGGVRACRHFLHAECGRALEAEGAAGKCIVCGAPHDGAAALPPWEDPATFPEWFALMDVGGKGSLARNIAYEALTTVVAAPKPVLAVWAADRHRGGGAADLEALPAAYRELCVAPPPQAGLPALDIEEMRALLEAATGPELPKLLAGGRSPMRCDDPIGLMSSVGSSSAGTSGDVEPPSRPASRLSVASAALLEGLASNAVGEAMPEYRDLRATLEGRATWSSEELHSEGVVALLVRLREGLARRRGSHEAERMRVSRQQSSPRTVVDAPLPPERDPRYVIAQDTTTMEMYAGGEGVDDDDGDPAAAAAPPPPPDSDLSVVIAFRTACDVELPDGTCALTLRDAAGHSRYGVLTEGDEADAVVVVAALSAAVPGGVLHVKTCQAASDIEVPEEWWCEGCHAACPPSNPRCAECGRHVLDLRGTRVAMRPAVTRPRFGWGCLRRGDVGVLQSVEGTPEGPVCALSFPRHPGAYTAVPSDIVLLPPVAIAAGSVVRVAPHVATPFFGWGAACRDDAGRVVAREGEVLTVALPTTSAWRCLVTEVMLIPE
eukprot:TRINITY_DN3884_c0_g2_i1.p1 TRINITY_DN3884_c0_g2~~TRINITY_DN3884_c0_g2_i1.p1  ORF type:complete len:616 (+),score=206.22 TRINITY_DN3884_c0_g2_i1:135-1850(+)